MKFSLVQLHTLKLLALITALVFVFGLASTTTFAQANPQMNYQGKLTNASGVAVPDGTYNMRFWLIDSGTAATSTALWTESLTGTERVQVTNGLFSVMLGSSSALTGVDFNQTLYLGVEIGGTGGSPAWDGEMSPRKILGTVPAAFVATTAVTASSANSLSGIASSSFLRSDEADTMSGNSSSPLLTLIQNGIGKIASFFSGAAEVFSILANGNVGVSSSTPGALLTIQGNNGTAPLFVVSTSTDWTGTTTPFVIDAAGNVGIGTSTPSKQLVVQGPIDFYEVGTDSPLITVDGSLSMNGSAIEFYDSTSLTASMSAGTGSFGISDANTGRFSIIDGGALSLHDSFGVAALTVTASGDIGIGDPSPSAKLEVAGNTIITGTTALATTTATNLTLSSALGATSGGTGLSSIAQNQLLIGGPGNTWTQIATSALGLASTLSGGTNGFLARWTSDSALSSGLFRDNGTVAGVNATSSSYTFNVQGSAGVNAFNVASSSGTSILAVTSNSRVGIGSTTPSHTFSVNGTAAVDNIIAASTTAVSTIRNRLDIGVTALTHGNAGTLNIRSLGSNTNIGLKNDSLGEASISFNTNIHGLALETHTDIPISIRPNNVTSVYFAGNGNVAIGTSSPWAELSLQGSYGSVTKLFEVATTTSNQGATSSIFAILANGNVGVGSTSPAAKFGVNGLSLADNFRAASTTATSTFLGPVGFGTSSPVSSFVVTSNNAIFQNTSNGTSFRVNDSNGSYILAVDTSGSVVSVGGGLSASGQVSADTATFTNNVGIGSSTPSHKLTVVGNSYIGGNLRLTGALLDSTAATGTLGMVLQTTGTSTRWVATSTLGLASSLSGGTNGFLARWTSDSALSSGLFRDNGTVAGVNATSSSYTFNVQGSAGVNAFNVASSSGTSILAVTSNSRVGIGTSTPTQQLSVAGNALFRNLANSANAFEVQKANGDYVFSIDTSTTQTFFGGATFAADGMFGKNGDEGSPTFSFTNDSDTGIFGSGGSNYIGFTTGGVEKMRINSAGNVGIGSSTPASLLTVAGNGYFGGNITATGSLAVSGGAIFSSTTASFSFGTSSPVAQFTINGNRANSANSTFLSVGTETFGVYNNNNRILAVGSNSTGDPLVEISGAGTLATSRVIGAGFQSLVLVPGGSSQAVVMTDSNASQNNAVFYSDGRVSFGTSTNSVASTFIQSQAGINPFAIASSTGVSLLTLTQAGDLGIGTTSPAAKLGVNGIVLADRFIAASTTATSTFANGIQLLGGCFRDANATSTCIGRGQSATYVVAASNSKNKIYADYIADGTGDQVEINAAIAAAYTASRGAGGKVYLLEGDYSVSSSTNMATGTMLVGSGPGTILKLANSTNGTFNLINITGTPSQRMSGVTISDLVIDGNRANQASGGQIGIQGTHAASSTITRVAIRNTRSSGIAFDYSNSITIDSNTLENVSIDTTYYLGIELYSDNASYPSFGHVVSNNKLINAGGPTGFSVLLYNTFNSIIDGNSLVVDGAVSLDAGIQIRTTSVGDFSYGNIISNNSLYGYPNSSISLYDESATYTVHNNTVTGNSITDSAIGINLVGYASNNTVTGNTIYSTSENGIVLNASDDNLIASNVITDNGGAGTQDAIVIANSDRNLISGNRIDTVVNQAVEIDSSSLNNTLVGNYYTNTATTAVNDAGLGTRYTQFDRLTLDTRPFGSVGYSLLSIYASSSVALASTTQMGTGKILSLNNSAGEMFTVANNGNVGIGTSTPYTKLTVSGSLGLTGGLLDSTSATGTLGMVLQTTGTSTRWVATSTLGITSSLSGGTEGFLARWTSASALSTGLFRDNGTVAGVNATSSSYTFNVQGTSGINPFNVASSTGTSLFTITNNGRVGIGSTTPTATLSVAGSSIVTGSATTSGNGYIAGRLTVGADAPSSGDVPNFEVAGSNPSTRLSNVGFGSLYTYITSGGTGFSASGAGGHDNFRFYTGTNGDFIGTNERLTIIGGTGNVGIGSSTPAALFGVAGLSLADYFRAASTTATSTFMGSLGIGTSSPAARLGVNGVVLADRFIAASSTATSTFANGIQLLGGCFRDANATSTCIGRGQSATYVVAASNSKNKIYADYIADGTGDQVEINAAIAAAYTASRGAGGKVYLLEGDYSVSSSTYMATGTMLIGSGPGTILKLANSINANINIISIIGTPAQRMSGVTVSDLAIDGNRDNQASGIQMAILGYHIATSTIERVAIRNTRATGIDIVYAHSITIDSNVLERVSIDTTFYAAIDLLSDNTSYPSFGHIVTNNKLTASGGGLGNSIQLYNTNNSIIDGNSLLVDGAVSIDSGIHIRATSAGDFSYGNIISSNVLFGYPNNAISLYDEGGIYTVHNNVITGNYIGNSSVGIYLTGSANKNTVTNNNIYNISGRSISLANSDDNLIGNNSITDSAGDAIELSGSDRNLISSNRIDTVVNQAVDIDSSSRDNTLVGNYYTNTATTAVNDAGLGTRYTQWDRITLDTRQFGSVGHSLLSIYASSSVALASTTQMGTGKILSLNNSAGEMFTVANGGNVGIGTSTPYAKLTVAGGLGLTGAFLDSTSATGTLGMVLQSTGTSTRWVATSTLGISGSLSGGTEGFLARWTSASALSTGLFRDNGTVSGVNATSSSYTFNVQGSAGVNAFNVASSSGTSILTVTSNSRVGIGSTTPSHTLSVNGTAAVANFVAASTTGISTIANRLDIGLTDLSHGNAGALNIRSLGSSASLGFKNDTVGEASISFNNLTYGLALETHNFDVPISILPYGIMAAYFSPEGKVGIGTSTLQSTRLTVDGGMSLSGALLDSTRATGTLGMILQSTGTSTRWVATSTLGITGGSSNWTDNGTYLSTLGSGDGIVVNGSSTIGGGTASTGLTIMGNATTTGNAYFAGNVGIGTNSPGSQLHISGSSPTVRIAAESPGQSSGIRLEAYDSNSNYRQSYLGLVPIDGTNQSYIGIGNGTDYLFNFRMDGNLGLGTTSPVAKLTVVGNGYFGGNITATGTLVMTGTATSSFAGALGIGTTSPFARGLTIDRSAINGTSTAGIGQYLAFANSSAGAQQFGNSTYIRTTNTATTTLVGSILRLEDSTTYGNTVRGFEVQTERGTNTLGENTAISGFARTFGVRGVTEGDAGGTYEPAGVYGETRGTTQGNAIRGYSSTITTASLLKLFQDTSTFTGTGLLMNFGNSGGTFSSTTASRFIDLQNGGTSRFTVGAYGALTIGDGTTSNNAGIQIGYGGLCVDNDGSCNASTTGRISSVSTATGNSDLAEMYFSNDGLEPGEVVYLKGGLSVGRASESTKDLVIGVVSTLPGLVMGQDDISLRPGEEAHPIALKGRVPVKVSNENGDVKTGDELMLSNVPGVVMKASSTGTVVGIALEDYEDNRAYSETFINQFGESIIVPDYTPIDRVSDPRINDGCYFGGGSEAGEAPCVPLRATTTSAQYDEADALALAEAKERALRSLARQSSDVAITAGGDEVRVGQIVMFVDLRYRYLDADGETMLAALSAQIGEEETDTVWSRLVELAHNFVDGVLSVLTLKADRVETNELCVDGVCVTADDLRTLLEGGAEVPVEPEPDEVPEEVVPDNTDEDAPPEGEESAGGDEGGEETVTEEETVSEEIIPEVTSEEETTGGEGAEEPIVTPSEPEPEVPEEVVPPSEEPAA
jgi:parallel beta-helix repeat protein